MTDFEFLNRLHKSLKIAISARPYDTELNALERETWRRLLAAPQRAHRFELAGRECRIDGVPIPSRGKGLPLAWMVLAARQYGLNGLRADWIFQSDSATRCALQALGRAGADAERVSPPLAAAIRKIGTRKGMLVLKSPPVGIVCTSPRLAQAVRGVISA